MIASTWLYFREREARKDAVAAEREQVRLRGDAEQARSSESQQRRQAESERRLALRTAYNSDMNLIQQAMAANNFGRTVDLLNRHRPGKKVERESELRVERSAAARFEPVAEPLTRPSGTLSPSGGEGRGEGVSRLMQNGSELKIEKRTPDQAETSLNSQLSPLSTDLRQWEWRYFWNQYRSDAAFALPRQSNSITTVAISPDGRFLVSNGTPGALKLWDLFRRAEVATFRVGGFGPGFGAGAFAFSPKGERFAALNDDRRRTTIKVWALPTREVLAEISLEGGVQALAFNADGTKLLAVGQEFGQDLILRSWDFEKQEWLPATPVKLPGEGIRPRGLIFSPDARRLAISDEAGLIRIIDSATGLETKSVAAFEEGMVHSLAFSPDGEWLAATAFMTETSIKLFKVETGAQVFKLTGHASWVPGVAFSADGKRLISASGDQTVRLWDLEQRRELAALRGHLSEVNCVAMTPDGRTIVSGCKDGSLFGWDAERIDPRKAFETLPVPVASVEFLPDGQSLLSVNQDGAVSLWDATTLQERERISAFGGRVARLLVASDGARIYASMPQGEIKVLDWKTRLILTNLAAPSGSGFSNRPGPAGRGFSNRPGRGFSSGLVGLVNEGRTLVTTGPGSSIRLWETESWQPKDLPKGGEGSSFPRFQMAPMILSPDGRFVIAVGRDGGIDFRNLLTGQTDKTLPAPNRWVSGLAFSPDGDLLAMSSVEGTVNLLEASNGTVVDVLRGHLLGVHAVAFSPDGQRIASGSHGTEAVKLWDVVTRQEVATLAGQGSMFGSVKFSPGGKLLVAVNGQGLAHVWRAPTLPEIEAAENTPAALAP